MTQFYAWRDITLTILIVRVILANMRNAKRLKSGYEVKTVVYIGFTCLIIICYVVLYQKELTLFNGDFSENTLQYNRSTVANGFNVTSPPDAVYVSTLTDYTSVHYKRHLDLFKGINFLTGICFV